jgi:WD40 repeat protein
MLQVCSAVFSPTDANLLAVGSSRFARLYDIRRLDSPLGSVTTPKSVSYVRLMGKHLVAASVDSVLCMYDTEQVARAAGANSVRPVREFRGHLNARNFVGLACSQSGYMFTGSENNSVVMYHRSVPAPVAEQSVVTTDAMVGGVAEATVSCVTITEAMDYVVTGGTTGWVNVMKLRS